MKHWVKEPRWWDTECVGLLMLQSHRHRSVYRQWVWGFTNFFSLQQPKWLKRGCEFITSGQCNYPGSGHVTQINMTQSAQSLTLVHDKVCQCLSIERTGLLGFVRFLLLIYCSPQHYKRAIVLQEGKVMNGLLKKHLRRKPSQRGCLY